MRFIKVVLLPAWQIVQGHEYQTPIEKNSKEDHQSSKYIHSNTRAADS